MFSFSPLAPFFAGLLSAALCAQDPPTPPGGFGIASSTNQLIAWTDGYRTLMDVYEPAFPAPATGWPGVLVLPGSGGHKNLPEIASKCRALAAAGYVAYVYDVRGSGSTRALNSAWTAPIGGAELLHDSAQSHGFADGFVAGRIDLARLAVTGFSEGGKHALQAAAWSGRPIPCPGAGCTITSYPTILAAAPENNDPDIIGKNMPGGVLVNDELVDDIPPTDPFVLALQAGDYPGFLALLQARFEAQVLPLFQQSTVPYFAMLAWQDKKHTPNSGVDSFFTLPATTPHRLFLTTGGHNTPENRHEELVLSDLRLRWFDRFLKGIPNGVELETQVEVAVQADQPAHMNLDSIWQHRSAASWPEALTPTVFHLRRNGLLSTNAATAVEAAPTIAHTVAPGYDFLTYQAQHASTNPPLAFASIPKVTATFVTPPFPATMELWGRARVELHALDSTGIFQLSAELHHVDASGAVQFITFGTGGIRSGVAGSQILRFDLGDIAHVIPSGHSLRLRVINLAHHVPPSHERIRWVPYFTSTLTALRIGPATPSKVELPLRPYQANLAPRLANASAATGIAHAMALRGELARAGWPYLVLLGISGEAPGTALPGSPLLPLNIDALTQLGLLVVNTPILPQFAGLLDPQGQAFPQFALPPAFYPSLAGYRLTFAGWTLAPGGTLEAFGATSLRIGP